MYFQNIHLRFHVKVLQLFISRRFSENTIFSLSSGYGKSGVAVIRVSGKNSLLALRSLTSRDFKPKPRYAHLRTFSDPKTSEIIDRGIALWFPGPKSFTGEDCCEFQVHGGIAVVQAVLDALGTVDGLRMAKPGEFTRRAFFNGKLDLTEVEGLADLIHAETELQRKQALLQCGGVLSNVYNGWRKTIVNSIAHLEAYIDFSDEENIEEDIMTNVKRNLTDVRNEVKNHLNDSRQGEILRNGVQIVIIGAPNVGKSSFLNYVCRREIAIVTPIAGTTRDVIESSYNISGYPVLFADTAGLRTNSDDVIEKEGMIRSIDKLKSADLIILMIDVIDWFNSFKDSKDCNIKTYIQEYQAKLGIGQIDLSLKSVLMIGNKIDLISKNIIENLCQRNQDEVIFISCKTGENINLLLEKLSHKLKVICGEPSAESPRLSQSRHRHLLTNCIDSLDLFLQICSSESNPDLGIAAQKLRKAVRSIESITGVVTSDEILDVIFRDFCIGK